VKEDLKLSASYGVKILNVYDKWGSTNNLLVENIGASALYLLSAPSTPESAREEAMERAEAGESVTHKTAKEIADAHKEIERLKKELADKDALIAEKDAFFEELELNKEEDPTPKTYPLLSNIQALLDEQRILPAKGRAVQTLTPEGQAIWFTDHVQKLSLENQLIEQKAKIKDLESKPQPSPQIIEKVVETVPDDYDNLKKQVISLTKAVETKKQQLEKETKEKESIQELKASVEKTLVSKLDKANEELSKLDYKRRELKASQDLGEASKLIDRAITLFSDERGGSTTLTQTILLTAEAIKKKLDRFMEQSSNVIIEIN